MSVDGIIRIEYNWMCRKLLFLLGCKLGAKVIEWDGASQGVCRCHSMSSVCSFISSMVLFMTHVTMVRDTTPSDLEIFNREVCSVFWAIVGHDMCRAQEYEKTWLSKQTMDTEIITKTFWDFYVNEMWFRDHIVWKRLEVGLILLYPVQRVSSCVPPSIISPICLLVLPILLFFDWFSLDLLFD